MPDISAKGQRRVTSAEKLPPQWSISNEISSNSIQFKWSKSQIEHLCPTSVERL